jgi:hypothetical protein
MKGDRVLVESPYAGDVKRHILYLKACMRDCLDRGEYPFASHMLYTQVLDDSIPEERELGIRAGLAWGGAARLTVVYEDLGISNGMAHGIEVAKKLARTVEYRRLPEDQIPPPSPTEPVRDWEGA